MHTRSLIVAILPLAASLLVGCQSGPTKTDRATPPAQALFRGDGTPITPAQADMVLAEADFVILGENHGHTTTLAHNAARWKAVLAAKPAAVLAFEFFERDQQVYIDDYLAGLIEEPVFRQRARKTTESDYPAGHREMLESAKAAKRPVIAANAPRAYVRKARTDGYDSLNSLTPEQRRLVRLPDSQPSDRYREDFGKVMDQKPDTAARVDAMFRSQCVWDWTMAESVARASAQGTPVVLVVGRFHSDHRGGLVQALEKLAPGKRIVTVTSVDSPATGTLAEDDKGRADIVEYVGETEKQ